MKKRLPKKGRMQHLEHSELSEEDKKTAEATRQLMQHIQQESLPASEKEYIWTQVEAGIEQKKRIRLSRVWYSIAAAVTLLLLAGLGYITLNRNSGSAMQEIASSVVPDPEVTRLVLADQRTVNLTKQNSSLTYKEDGGRIQIDSSSAISQDISGQEFNTLVVPYGKRSVITLVDGTKIWLNSGSKLVYPAQFASGEREVYLEGQAYFSVTHAADHPFFVHTKNMKVQVFGTEFDISAYNDDAQTSAVLVSGSVELTANTGSLFRSKKTKMVPGTRTVYTPGNLSLVSQQVKVEQYVAWKDGYLALDKAPLGEILKQLSRYYNVSIQLDEQESDKKTFSGSLDLRENVRFVLDIVSTTTSHDYYEMERRFVLREKTVTQ
jgi:hypothetical protein